MQKFSTALAILALAVTGAYAQTTFGPVPIGVQPAKPGKPSTLGVLLNNHFIPLGTTDGTSLLSLPAGLAVPTPLFTGTALGIPVTGQGSVNALFSPVFNDSVSVGVFVNPVSYGATSPGAFLTAFNMQHGKPGAPIPAGTKGNLGGYECNQNLMQAVADVTEGSHCFGGTFVTGNGAPFNGLAMTGTINNVEANLTMIDLNMTNNVANSLRVPQMIFLNSSGSHPVPLGIGFNGAFGMGIDFNSNSLAGGGAGIRHATNIGFSGNPGYFVDGSQADIFRITGGGTAKGMILYGGNGTGVDGTIHFRNNANDNTEGLAVDGGTGALKLGPAAFTPNGAVSVSLTATAPAAAHATVQEWLTITDAAGNTRYIPAF